MIVGPANTVTHIWLMGREVSGGTNRNQPGYNYAVGELVTHSGTVGGGSGVQWTIPEVGSFVDNGGNVSDFDGSGAIGTNIGSGVGQYLDPERTASTYMTYLGLSNPFNATDSFINAVIANFENRHGGTYNSLLSADSLNDYIRQGMSKTMLGSAYASGVSPTPPPISWHKSVYRRSTWHSLSDLK